MLRSIRLIWFNMIDYRFFQKLKLVENYEFNLLTIILSF